MSLINDVLKVTSEVTRGLQGEPVTLRDAEGNISAEISDAIVSVERASVGDPGQGPARQFGTLRLYENHRTAALSSTTALVRGVTFYLVDVGEAFGGLFRCEISTNADQTDGRQTNLVDLDGNQAVWHEED
jgi:hypothetical protein